MKLKLVALLAVIVSLVSGMIYVHNGANENKFLALVIATLIVVTIKALFSIR